MTILSLAIVATVVGFVQLPKLSLSLHKPLHLDVLLANITTYGVFIYAIFGIYTQIASGMNENVKMELQFNSGLIVGGTNLSDDRHVMVFVSNGLLLIQATLQGMFIAEASKRVCTSRYQMLFKPGRQIVTFLLFANITLWLLDMFMPQNSWLIQDVLETSSITDDFLIHVGYWIYFSLHLTIVYRFHQSLMLIHIWTNSYYRPVQ